MSCKQPRELIPFCIKLDGGVPLTFNFFFSFITSHFDWPYKNKNKTKKKNPKTFLWSTKEKLLLEDRVSLLWLIYIGEKRKALG
jgi:hypothetical protein